MSISVIIESVSYTPGREFVHIHYMGKGVKIGPLAKTTICHTTQAALAARAPAGTPEGYWSDAEIRAELQAHLVDCGFQATVVDNPTLFTFAPADQDLTSRLEAPK